MNKRTRWYIILGSILAAVHTVAQMLKFLEVIPLPLWLNLLLSTVYAAMLVAILWILGGDERVKRGWRTFARFMAIFLCCSFLGGLVLSLLGV